MKPFLAAASLAAVLAAGSAAQALPFQALPFQVLPFQVLPFQVLPLPSQPTPVQSDVLRVSGGCGLGWHRGPYGGCRPNGYGYYGPYAAYTYPGYYPGRCWWTATPYGARRMCAW